MVQRKKIKIGVLGCGAIGSRMAQSIQKELNQYAVVSGIYDIQDEKVKNLAKKISKATSITRSFDQLLKTCDLVVEAVNAQDTQQLIRKSVQAKKDVLVMSVGKLLGANEIFNLADRNQCRILIPSGAIAGIDAIKAASLRSIRKITLTTRKPTFGFVQNDYFTSRKIFLSKIKTETVLFDGNVRLAVKYFPQNLNVAATIAFASKQENKLRIRILTSPTYKLNSHEIEVLGDFGRLTTKTDNEVCPDNPKTSYLAVLSAIQTLKQHFQEVKIGT